jgi:hypothetical protein
MNPVNKQAALFLTRKPRVETVSEALEIFANKITSPDTANKVREIIKCMNAGEDTEVSISLKIRPEFKHRGGLVVTIQTRTSNLLGAETFNGLH